jgi:integrase
VSEICRLVASRVPSHLNATRRDGGAASRSLGKAPGRGFVTRRTARMCRPGVHILRHTFCSHLVVRGAAMRAVQELVGHQDLTMTQRYSHLSPAALVDTIRLLESRVAASGRGEILETAIIHGDSTGRGRTEGPA